MHDLNYYYQKFKRYGIPDKHRRPNELDPQGNPIAWPETGQMYHELILYAANSALAEDRAKEDAKEQERQQQLMEQRQKQQREQAQHELESSKRIPQIRLEQFLSGTGNGSHGLCPYCHLALKFANTCMNKNCQYRYAASIESSLIEPIKKEIIRLQKENKSLKQENERLKRQV